MPRQYRVRSPVERKTPAERPSGAPVLIGQWAARQRAGDLHVQAMKAFESRQVDDPFGRAGQMGGYLSWILPPYDMNSLIKLPNESSTLRECIEAMKTNVVGHGWRLEYIGPDDQEDSAPAKAEAERIKERLKFSNDDMPFETLLDHWYADLETTGNAYLEVQRDLSGKISSIWHLPAHTIRLTAKDPEPVQVKMPMIRDGRATTVPVIKRFRRYIQIVGGKRVYFKEYGDPRTINHETGLADDTLPFEQSATELIHEVVYSPGSAYGLPRWIGALPAVLGSRQAELTNLDFFQDNAIPALAILVSGGSVSQQTLDHVEQTFSQARGRTSMNRIAVIEATGDQNAASEQGTIPAPRLEIKQLRAESQSDALFLDYQRLNRDGVRSTFRLPPIFLGQAEDYSHASAKVSYEVAEGQVFDPARNRIEAILNQKILADVGMKYWVLKFNPAQITDQAELAQAAQVLETMGAMTPNIAIALAAEFFGIKIPPIREAWGDLPFTVVRELVSAGAIPGAQDAADKMRDGVVPAGEDAEAEPEEETAEDEEEAEEEDQPQDKAA